MQSVPYVEYKKYLDKRRNCIICEKKTSYKIWAKDSYFKAIKCKSCGMVSIEPPLSEVGLNLYYQNNFHRREDAELKWSKRIEQYKLDKELIENFINKGNCLDVGCGGGLFLESLNNNFKKFGIDIDKTSIDYAKKNFKSDYRVESLGKDSLKNKSFDLIIMRGVIEHVLDPNLYVKRCGDLLKKGGLVYICATPNINSFTAEIYKNKWNLWHPIQHINLFDEKTLSSLFKKYGFERYFFTYPYINTPYESHINDSKSLIKDIFRIKNKQKIKNISPPFWGNMISIIFKKK